MSAPLATNWLHGRSARAATLAPARYRCRAIIATYQASTDDVLNGELRANYHKSTACQEWPRIENQYS